MATSSKNRFRGFHAEDRARQRAIYGLDQEVTPGVATLGSDDHHEPALDHVGESEAGSAQAFSGAKATATGIPHWPFEGD